MSSCLVQCFYLRSPGLANEVAAAEFKLATSVISSSIKTLQAKSKNDMVACAKHLWDMFLSMACVPKPTDSTAMTSISVDTEAMRKSAASVYYRAFSDEDAKTAGVSLENFTNFLVF